MREGLFLNHRLDSVAIPMASLGGIVQGEKILGPVPQGYCWYVENFAHYVIGAQHSCASVWAVVPDDGPLGGKASGFPAWDGQGLVMFIGATVTANVFNSPPTYVGPGHVLHVVAGVLTGGGTVAAGDVVTATAQIAVHQLDPHYMMSHEDTVQVQDARERTGAELALSAVSERRAV